MLAHLLAIFDESAVVESGEPLSLADVKRHLNIAESDTTYDALLAAYIPAAREYVENYTGHVLLRREFTEYRAGFGDYIELFRRPVFSVDDVGYTDSDGAPAVYAGYVASTDRNPARVYPALDVGWPTLGTNGTVSAAYTAGYAPGQEPAAMLHAMKLILAHWFASREGVVNAIVSEVPHAATALMDQYRVPVL